MYADCRYAEDTEIPLGPDGSPSSQELGCKLLFKYFTFYTTSSNLKYANFSFILIVHSWKHRYAASCLSRTVRVVFSSKPPPYSEVMDLDKQIRKFPIPSALQCPTQEEEGPDPGQFWSTDPLQATKQFCALCIRESSE